MKKNKEKDEGKKRRKRNEYENPSIYVHSINTFSISALKFF